MSEQPQSSSASRMKRGLVAAIEVSVLIFGWMLLHSPVRASEEEISEIQQIHTHQETNRASKHEEQSNKNAEPSGPPPLKHEKNAAATTPQVAEPNTQDASDEVGGSWIVLGHQLGITDTLLAVFSGGLLAATVLMFLVACWQGWIARDTARRELRAYLTIGESGLIPGSTDIYQVEIANAGKTPAYRVRVWRWIAIMEIPLTTIPGPKGDVPSTDISLGPGRSHFIRAKRRLSLTPDQEQQVNTGTHAVCIWGEIEYLDAFGETHRTKFCLQEDRSAGPRAGLKNSVIGNDAD